MNRISWLALLLTLFIPVAPAAEPFQAGRHYLELPTPQPVETGDKIELREFFWYGCPHCFFLEPALTAYVAKLPRNAEFVRTPGVSPNWLIHAQAYYTFEALDVTSKLHAPFFHAWHVNKRRFNDVDSIAAFAVEQGVEKDKFLKAFNSFSVRTRLQRARQQNVGFMVEGVPTLAVDGRYVTSPIMAGGDERSEARRNELTMQVVDFLIQKAARERKNSAAR